MTFDNFFEVVIITTADLAFFDLGLLWLLPLWAKKRCRNNTILFGKAVRKFANAVNRFTGFFRATPPALILPLADVKIGIQGSPTQKDR